MTPKKDPYDTPVFRATRATAKTKQRRYRADKRNPQGVKITVQEDLGTLEQTQQYFFESATKRRARSKKKNPNLIYILKSPIRIAYYTNSKKLFLYSQDGIYLGELEKHDQRKVFSELGLILRGKKTLKN